jgi:hypothetical protein
MSEETGMEAEELVSLGVYYPSVAVLDEKIHLYLARGLTQKESTRRGRVSARRNAAA